MPDHPDINILFTERHVLVDVPPALLLTLNRPDKRNCLSRQLLTELTAAVTGNRDRLLVITGSGPSFCSGLDLAYLQNAIDRDDSPAGPLGLLRKLYEALRTHPLPTIALVNGPAVGGGVGLAAICDAVIAAPQASFTLPGGDYALLAGVVVPLLNARSTSEGPDGAGWLGTTVTATRATQIGLANQTAPDRAALTIDAAARLLTDEGLHDRKPAVPRGGTRLTHALDSAFLAAVGG